MRENENKRYDGESRSGRMLAGLALLLIGLVLFGQKLDIFFLPDWVFSWPMILIIVGFFVGIKNNFESWPWAFLIILGSVFLLNNAIPDMRIDRFLWPIILVTLGFLFLVRPSSCRRRRHIETFTNPPTGFTKKQTTDTVDEAEIVGNTTTRPVFDDEEYIRVNSVFGGSTRNVFSKNFKGGEVNCFMGGAQIDLSKADINGTVSVEANQVFGGTKLIVPAHWLVKNEITAVFGGVDDKRKVRDMNTDNSKVLILKGFALFGGVEIITYSY